MYRERDRDREIERERDGERWRDGEMERWRDGETITVVINRRIIPHCNTSVIVLIISLPIILDNHTSRRVAWRRVASRRVHLCAVAGCKVRLANRSLDVIRSSGVLNTLYTPTTNQIAGRRLVDLHLIGRRTTQSSVVSSARSAAVLLPTTVGVLNYTILY